MHKKFNEVKPYSYFLQRKSDGLKYVGVRYANVRLNLTPDQDFGKVYFTSGKLMKDFKRHPEKYTYRLCYTFDSIEEMFEWEKRVTLRVYRKSDWANQGWCSNYGENPEIGKLISEGKRAIKRSGKTSIEQGAETLKDWIWNTDEGATHREEISIRQKALWAVRTEEDIAAVQDKRKSNMDFKSAREKARVKLDMVGEDGLTGNQRNALKARDTRKARGLDSIIGKKRDDAFKKKLGEMSEEEFEDYCANRSNRFINNCKTKRRKYLEQLNSSNE